MANGRESVIPVPDPTILTTAALKMSIDNLHALLMTKIEDSEALFKQALRDRKELIMQRLEAIEGRHVEHKSDAEKSLVTALASQKELFYQQQQSNAESSTRLYESITKQLDALRAEAALSRESFGDKVTALKERIDRGTGKEEQQVTNKTSSQWMIALIIAVVLSVLGDIILMTQIFLNKP